MFEGIITALVTPFHEDDSLNLAMIPKLIDRQVNAGVSAIAVTAGAGEYVSLRAEERIHVIRCTSDALQKRLPLIAGIIEPDTRSAITAALAAREAGAQALLVLTPYYLKPSNDGLVSHFELIAKQTDVPIIAYNNPARTGINLDLAVLERLAAISRVVAVKECDRDLGRVANKIDRLGSSLSFLSGEDDLCLPSFSIGAKGAIMAASNLAPAWAVAIFKAVHEQNWTEALNVFSRLLKFIALYDGPDHPAPLKAVMCCAGFPVGKGRLPLQPPTQLCVDEITRRLGELDILKEMY